MCVTKSPEVSGLIAAGPKTKERGANENELSVVKSVIRQRWQVGSFKSLPALENQSMDIFRNQFKGTFST